MNNEILTIAGDLFIGNRACEVGTVHNAEDSTSAVSGSALSGKEATVYPVTIGSVPASAGDLVVEQAGVR